MSRIKNYKTGDVVVHKWFSNSDFVHAGIIMFIQENISYYRVLIKLNGSSSSHILMYLMDEDIVKKLD